MIVEFKTAREKVSSHVRQTLAGETVRVRYPGQGQVDIAIDKSMFIELRLVYMDGWSTGLGPNADMRRLGMIEMAFNIKEASSEDYLNMERLMDKLQRAVHSTDVMFPVRTYGTKPESPRQGPKEGWVIETLVTPFWYDTSK